MSRSWKVLFAATLIPGSPAMAQAPDPPPASDREIAQGMLSTGGRITPDKSRSHCLRTARPGEIVVCGPDDDEYRIPSTADSDPESAQALNDGRLHPPNVAGGGIFKGKATMGGMCMLPPCPPPAAYIIDLSTIPMAPAGSDADKIARGEMRAP